MKIKKNKKRHSKGKFTNKQEYNKFYYQKVIKKKRARIIKRRIYNKEYYQTITKPKIARKKFYKKFNDIYTKGAVKKLTKQYPSLNPRERQKIVKHNQIVVKAEHKTLTDAFVNETTEKMIDTDELRDNGYYDEFKEVKKTRGKIKNYVKRKMEPEIRKLYQKTVGKTIAENVSKGIADKLEDIVVNKVVDTIIEALFLL